MKYPVGSSGLNASVFSGMSLHHRGVAGLSMGSCPENPRVPGAWSARRGEVPIEVDWREEMLFFLDLKLNTSKDKAKW